MLKDAGAQATRSVAKPPEEVAPLTAAADIRELSTGFARHFVAVAIGSACVDVVTRCHLALVRFVSRFLAAGAWLLVHWSMVFGVS
mmetsp:Transcript_6824/g.15318  ORF Transcript_6824/g.15318 Transcript_6824/m.15318 type:complete len:86 (+) Transcript_6824:6979-7236(+)